MPPIRVLIGVPTAGDIKAQTVASILSNFHNDDKIITLMCFEIGSLIHLNRKRLVKTAIQIKADYIWFVDTDMAFAPGILEALLHDSKDIVGANYNQKVIPLHSTVKMADENGKLINDPNWKSPSETFECFSIATGCLLVKTSVFSNIPKPWFFYEDDDSDDDVGEDIWFCMQARKAGYKIWCNPLVKCGHLGTFTY
jgi:hypothetical protein